MVRMPILGKSSVARLCLNRWQCARNPQILYSRFMVRSQADTPLFSVPSPDQK